jgi:hypothetical protein
MATNTASDAIAPEAAVRLYLTYLDDPTKLIDNDKTTKLEKKLADTKDPIDRLMAMAALHRARAADPSGIISDFTRHAKRWADAEGVPEGAFRELGVPDDVLKAAGFGKGKRGQANKAMHTAGPRRNRISTEQLTEGILQLDGAFSIRDVSEQIGGSSRTVKDVISTLEAQGKIQPAGEQAGGRGRAAKIWTVS